MEILLDFVYTETVLVTVENVQELLPAACLLQLKGRIWIVDELLFFVLLQMLLCIICLISAFASYLTDLKCNIKWL